MSKPKSLPAIDESVPRLARRLSRTLGNSACESWQHLKAGHATLSVVFAVSLGLAAFAPQAEAQLSQDRMIPIQLPRNLERPRSREPDSSLESVLRYKELPTVPVQPVSLEGLNIPGVQPSTVRTLGMYHFAVINNTPFSTMAELYRDNRLKGKPNFVTADCIVHPYLATTNGIIAAVIETSVCRELETLLQAMLKSSIADFRASEDGEVRDDIQRNLAFISVGLRLIAPDIQLQDLGGATDLADAELLNIKEGKTTRSAIFDRTEDFSNFQPAGWYTSGEKLRNFYACAQWISRMSFPLTDVTVDTATGGGNLFRRSVLLYRSLERATIDGRPALNTWKKLVSVWDLFGSLNPSASSLLATDFQSVVPDSASDLKALLVGLSQPFYRAKLLLSVRRQKTVGLGTTSIFDLNEGAADKDAVKVFRLMPLIQDPEMPWLKARSANYLDEEKGGAWCPLALFVLHSRGAPQATNLLFNGMANIDPEMGRYLPQLERAVGALKNAEQPSERNWKILSGYFKPFPEGAQPPLKSELWLIRHLESAFAGWLDQHLSITPLPKAKANTEAGAESKPGETASPAAPAAAESAAAGSAAADSTDSQASASPVKKATYHYLEPCVEIYKNIESDAQMLMGRLSASGYLSEEHKTRLNDFIRLTQRLRVISERELESAPLSQVDFGLLAGIDLVLERVVAPLASSLNISGGPSARENAAAARESSAPLAPPSSSSAARRGVNLILGRPGQVLMIFQTNQGAILGRGAVYTYYEQSGGPIKTEHLARKLNFGMLRPPAWTSDFDLVQETITKR